jgi:hypothetical protein
MNSSVFSSSLACYWTQSFVARGVLNYEGGCLDNLYSLLLNLCYLTLHYHRALEDNTLETEFLKTSKSIIPQGQSNQSICASRTSKELEILIAHSEQYEPSNYWYLYCIQQGHAVA